jgi:hypothetical protein
MPNAEFWACKCAPLYSPPFRPPLQSMSRILFEIYGHHSYKQEARGSVVGWGTMLQAGRSPVRVPDDVDFFHLHNPSSRIMALGSTQPLTEMSTRNFPGGKKRAARRADNLAAIYELNVWNVGVSTSRNPKGLHGLYRDNFTVTFIFINNVNVIKATKNNDNQVNRSRDIPESV